MKNIYTLAVFLKVVGRMLQPGKKYVLRYRMLVYDGSLSAAQAEQAWKGFAIPPKMTVKRLK